MKYLFIELEIQDGERQHTHRCLHTTKCNDIYFAGEYYAAHFWGYSEREFKDDAWYAHAGEIAITCTKVKELTQLQYEFLHSLFHGGTLIENEEDLKDIITESEFIDFKEEWGQTHEEICSALDLDKEGAEDFLRSDYFWSDNDQRWYPTFSSMYSEKEQKIADFLQSY